MNDQVPGIQILLPGASIEDIVDAVELAQGIKLIIPEAKIETRANLSVRNAINGKPPAAPQAERFAVIPASKFLLPGPREWLIQNVRPAHAALAVTYGPSGCGKSAIVIDQACAMSRGVPWRGLPTRKSRVVYLCAEGAHDFRFRIGAYAKEFDVDRDELPSIIEEAPDLLQTDDVTGLIASIKKAGGCDELIVDTWSQCMSGDENTSKDAGKALRHCKQIHAETGALIHLIAHTGKDETKGVRGWSGMRAACDAEYEVSLSGNRDTRVLKVTKMKGGRSDMRYAFQLREVAIGTYSNGKSYGSIVVDPTPTDLPHAERAVRGTKLHIKNALQNVAGPLSIDEIRLLVLERMPAKLGNRRDTRSENISRAINAMVAEKLIVQTEDGRIALAGECNSEGF